MADRPDIDAAARARSAPRREKSAFEFRDTQQGDDSIGTLLQRLAEQGTYLAEKQAELIRAELHSSVTDIKEAGGAMAGAAVLGIAGIGVTLMGIAYLIGSVIPLWLATLIVGIGALAGAYALFSGAQAKLQSKSMTAERTRHTIERAPRAMTGDTKDGASK